jgi:hypothetical protein
MIAESEATATGDRNAVAWLAAKLAQFGERVRASARNTI